MDQAVAGKACTVLFEDLGLEFVDKQHTDPAYQQQHHDVLDAKENQAQKITWPPWKTEKLLVNIETADHFIDLLESWKEGNVTNMLTTTTLSCCFSSNTFLKTAQLQILEQLAVLFNLSYIHQLF